MNNTDKETDKTPLEHVETWVLARWRCLLVVGIGIFIAIALLGLANIKWDWGIDIQSLVFDALQVVLTIAGGVLVILGISVATKRARIADDNVEQQREASEQQRKANIDNIQQQQKSLIQQRYTDAVEHLGNAEESVRLGGAYGLYTLAREHKDDYAVRVCDVFCSHIRIWTNKKNYENGKSYKELYAEKPSIEVQRILTFLTVTSYGESPPFESSSINLSDAFLYGADLINANLGGAKLY